MKVLNQVFDRNDSVLETALNQRLAKQNVLLSNLANSQTPGYRALGYSFESQLQDVIGNSDALKMQTNDSRHYKSPFSNSQGLFKADLFVKPTESIGSDGNSVDVDNEMAEMSENQILYRANIEILNRKLSMMKYALNGGRS